MQLEISWIHTGAFSIAHAKTLTAYTTSYFQGLLARSAPALYCGSGAEEGIAFRPEEVMVLGFEWEKRGRMKVLRMEVRMKSWEWVWEA